MRLYEAKDFFEKHFIDVFVNVWFVDKGVKI